METEGNFQDLLNSAENSIKTGIEQIRYELARQGFTKTPHGADLFLEQSVDLVADESMKALTEVRDTIFVPKEWETIRSLLIPFIDKHCEIISDFLIKDWEQPAAPITNQLKLIKSSVTRESNYYIDRQKVKLSKGKQILKDILKIFYYGIAAGIVGFLLKLIISR